MIFKSAVKVHKLKKITSFRVTLLSRSSKVLYSPAISAMGFPQVIAAFHAMYDMIGLPGNLLVIVVIILESRFHVMRYVLLASLALSDFLLLILVNSFRIKSIAQEHWLYGQTMCYLNPFFVRYFYINTVLHLVTVSYNRYLAIVKSPLTYDGTITKTRVAFIALIWIIPVIPVSISLFQGWGKYAYNPELIICEQGRAIDRQNGSITISENMIVVPIATILMPFLVILVLNVSVYKTANRQINAMVVQVGGPVDAEITQQQEMVSRQVRDRKAAVDVMHYYHCGVFGVLSSLLGFRHLSPVRPRNRCSSRGRSCHYVYFLPQHNIQPDYLFHP